MTAAESRGLKKDSRIYWRGDATDGGSISDIRWELTAPTRVLREATSEIVIPTRPTHTLADAADLLVLPALGARRVRKLEPKTAVTLVRSEAGWSLVARNGRPGWLRGHQEHYLRPLGGAGLSEAG
jgi:hypothetical protein